VVLSLGCKAERAGKDPTTYLGKACKRGAIRRVIDLRKGVAGKQQVAIAGVSADARKHELSPQFSSL
jgi:hypothetical protein